MKRIGLGFGIGLAAGLAWGVSFAIRVVLDYKEADNL